MRKPSQHSNEVPFPSIWCPHCFPSLPSPHFLPLTSFPSLFYLFSPHFSPTFFLTSSFLHLIYIPLFWWFLLLFFPCLYCTTTTTTTINNNNNNYYVYYYYYHRGDMYRPSFPLAACGYISGFLPRVKNVKWCPALLDSLRPIHEGNNHYLPAFFPSLSLPSLPFLTLPSHSHTLSMALDGHLYF